MHVCFAGRVAEKCDVLGDDTVKTGVEVGAEDCEEPDNLSDIDDAEVQND